MRILVVEDEKRMASFIKRGLKEEKYIVDLAYDGEKGFLLGTINSYDLIILEKSKIRIKAAIQQSARS